MSEKPVLQSTMFKGPIDMPQEMIQPVEIVIDLRAAKANRARIILPSGGEMVLELAKVETEAPKPDLKPGSVARKYNCLTLEGRERAIGLINRGYSFNSIAKELGVSVGVISRIAGSKGEITKDEKKAIAADAASMPLPLLVRKYRRTPSAIKKIIDEAGVKKHLTMR